MDVAHGLTNVTEIRRLSSRDRDPEPRNKLTTTTRRPPPEDTAERGLPRGPCRWRDKAGGRARPFRFPVYCMLPTAYGAISTFLTSRQSGISRRTKYTPGASRRPSASQPSQARRYNPRLVFGPGQHAQDAPGRIENVERDRAGPSQGVVDLYPVISRETRHTRLKDSANPSRQEWLQVVEFHTRSVTSGTIEHYVVKDNPAILSSLALDVLDGCVRADGFFCLQVTGAMQDLEDRRANV